MISVRLSESEYELLKKHYASLGTRSVSDLARAALQRVIGDQVNNGARSEPDPQTMDEKLSLLQSQVAKLSRAVTKLKKNSTNSDDIANDDRTGS